MRTVSKEVYDSIIQTSKKIGIVFDEDPNSERYSEDAITELYLELINRTDEYIGLRLGEHFDLINLGIWGEIMSSSISIDKTIKFMNLFQSHFSKDLKFSYTSSEETKEIALSFKKNTYQKVQRQIYDIHLSAMIRYLRETYHLQIIPIEIHFPYKRPNDLTLYEELGSPFHFDKQDCRMILKKEDVYKKNPLYIESLWRKVKEKAILQFLDSEDIIQMIYHYIEENLGHEKVSLAQFIRAKGYSLRKTERHLEKKGLSFNDILIEIRIKKLKSLIRTDIETKDLALELGLYDQSSLHHFTKRYMNKTLSELKNMS